MTAHVVVVYVAEVLLAALAAYAVARFLGDTIRTMLPRCKAVWWHPALRGTVKRCERRRWHLGRHRVRRIVVSPTWPHDAREDVVRWAK